MRLFGIETEYGITREGLDDVDPVVESMELVRAHLTSSFQRRWDYGGEDPHEDARGFRVSGLQQDREEDEFAKVDAHRPFSFHEMKSDLVLPNGARFYNDHTHPEYSTPECRTLRDLVAHDRAGERILHAAAQRRNRLLGDAPVQLYKNNTDFHGHSYGCHDNYLVARSVPFTALVTGLLPFLVTRQIVAGAGKVGIEGQEREFDAGQFQVSQRADFMETELSVDTMHDRPILNTRDEPHADRYKYRRLHLIIGDANMCEYATALKVGTTQVVLDLIARGAAPDIELADPVQAVKQISRDPSLATAVACRKGPAMTGLDIQERYLAAAEQTFVDSDVETRWVLREWRATVSALRTNRASLFGKLDWITKQALLEQFVSAEQIGWDDPWLASLDLEYHNIDPARGLYLGLEQEGKTHRIVDDTAITQAMREGPQDTRGGLRGLCVRRFPDEIVRMQWQRIGFRNHADPHELHVLEMGDLFDPSDVQGLAARLASAATPADALQDTVQAKPLR
ncbi:MAG: proteasome accessory factor PafA2 family protein [Nitrospiraceae bacterium]